MARSTSAISKTFIKEGKISYNNNDTGGLTYLGLAYNKWPQAEIWPKVFEVFRKVRPDITLSTLKSIGTSAGKQIVLTDNEEDRINELLEPLRKDLILFYKKQFWDTLNADNIISQIFAESFFDFSVNVGSGTGARILQEYLGVTQDGSIGPVTIGKLNAELLRNTYNVMIDFTWLKLKKYCKIVNTNSAQIKNLHGWLNRSFEVFDENYSIQIIENIHQNTPEKIPEELKNDITKLLGIYWINLEYGRTKNSSTLDKLLSKINETI